MKFKENVRVLSVTAIMGFDCAESNECHMLRRQSRRLEQFKQSKASVSDSVNIRARTTLCILMK